MRFGLRAVLGGEQGCFLNQSTVIHLLAYVSERQLLRLSGRVRFK